MNNNIPENEIDIKELFSKLKQNSMSILFIMMLFSSIVGVYVYFLPSIYSSSVTISLDNKEKSNLKALLPGQSLMDVSNNERLKLAKLTLKSKKFISSIIGKLNADRIYFIRKNFKNFEVDGFSNLKIDIHYKNKKLYGESFKIIPQGNDRFLLEIDKIKYRKIHSYNNEIVNQFFTLRVIKNEGKDPFADSWENRLYGSSYGTALIDSRAYIFKTYDRSTEENIIIQKLKVSTLSDTILKVVYEDTLAIRAKKILQEIAKSYIDYDLANKTAELEQTLEFLDHQILEVKQNLKNKGEKLKQYQQKNSTVAVMNSPSTLIDTIETKKETVEKLTLQLQEVRNFIMNLRKNKLSIVSLVSSGIDISSIQSLIETYRVTGEKIRTLHFQQKDISKSVTENMEINTLIRELKKSEMEVQNLRNNFTDEHPQVIEEEKNVNEIQNKIHSYIVINLSKLQKDKAIAKSTIISNMSIVERNLKNKLRLIKSDIRQKKVLLSSLPSKNLVSQDLKRNFTLSENVYTFLLQKKIELEISKASMIANTQIIENAVESPFPIKPNKTMIMLVGILLGLILGVLYAFLKVLLDTKVRNAHDVESLTTIPLYGTLPLKTNERFYKEALRSVRTNLQFVLSEHKNCTTILISSTIAGEGKTTVIAGLGEVISEANKKVLLMDLDLRKPRLHKELKERNKIGMSHFLSGDIDIYEHIIEINENLHFLSAGIIPPNPSELLMSDKFTNLILALEKEYDYILFDTPPIGSVTDANMLLKHSDIVLLTLKANQAEKAYLKYFNKLIKNKNIKSSGIILNGVNLHKNNGYGYGYGYGHDYTYGDKK